MIYLLLSILASSVIFLIFKLFAKFKVNNLQAIIFNYVFACITGIFAYSKPINFHEILISGWLIGATLLGILFIVIFYLMAITTQRSGLSVVSVATKMSMVIPILFGALYYKEEFGFLKLAGILLAFSAIYFASVKKKESIKIEKKNLIFPLLVFLGSGIIDTSIKFLENSFVNKDDVPLFSATIFASAFLTGLLIITTQIVKNTFKFEVKNLLGGIALGIPNYFSIYFIVQALRSGSLDSSTIFTINNVSIVLLSTFLGIVLFHERLLTKNWIGIVLAILSIILITVSR
ncbi:MAG: DMT family transporter [Leeuwenhoekiella sp.]